MNSDLIQSEIKEILKGAKEFEKYANKAAKIEGKESSKHLLDLGKGHGIYLSHSESPSTRFTFSDLVSAIEFYGNNIEIESFDYDKYVGLEDLAAKLFSVILNDPSFFGMTARYKEVTYNISNIFTLNMLLDEVEDLEEPVFNEVNIFRTKTSARLVESRYGDRYQQLQKLITHTKEANYAQYEAKVEVFSKGFRIEESLGGDRNYYVTVPVTTAYFSSIIFPYYGLECIEVRKGTIRALDVFPIMSPNCDHSVSQEVCTGTAIKSIDGIANLHQANFMSGYGAMSNGCMISDHLVVVNAHKRHCLELLSKKFEESYDLPDFLKAKPKKKHQERVETRQQLIGALQSFTVGLVKEISEEGSINLNTKIDEIEDKAKREYFYKKILQSPFFDLCEDTKLVSSSDNIYVNIDKILKENSHDTVEAVHLLFDTLVPSIRVNKFILSKQINNHGINNLNSLIQYYNNTYAIDDTKLVIEDGILLRK